MPDEIDLTPEEERAALAAWQESRRQQAQPEKEAAPAPKPAPKPKVPPKSKP